MNEHDATVEAGEKPAEPARRIRWFPLLWLMLAVAVIAVGFTALRSWNSGPVMGTGAVARAEKWKAILDAEPDPETIKTHYPYAAFKRFNDGSWIVGVGEDSHGDPDGGTLVFKENGRPVRALFGHVCGPSMLNDELSFSPSLADFHSRLAQSRFREYSFH